MQRPSGRPRVVVLSGAGVSAESGLRTFRDGDGLWEEHPVEDVATPEAFARDPERVLRFYDQRRHQLLGAEPNRGHRVIAELEEHFDVEVVTQNIDNLHERAGSTRVLHLHGELTKCRPVDRPDDLRAWSGDLKLGDTDERGVQLRPHVVWFGEAVPLLDEAAKRVAAADAVVVVGTSLSVYPAAGLLDAAGPEACVCVVDPNLPPGLDAASDRLFPVALRATEGLALVREELLNRFPGRPPS